MQTFDEPSLRHEGSPPAAAAAKCAPSWTVNPKRRGFYFVRSGYKKETVKEIDLL